MQTTTTRNPTANPLPLPVLRNGATFEVRLAGIGYGVFRNGKQISAELLWADDACIKMDDAIRGSEVRLGRWAK